MSWLDERDQWPEEDEVYDRGTLSVSQRNGLAGIAWARERLSRCRPISEVIREGEQ